MRFFIFFLSIFGITSNFHAQTKYFILNSSTEIHKIGLRDECSISNEQAYLSFADNLFFKSNQQAKSSIYPNFFVRNTILNGYLLYFEGGKNFNKIDFKGYDYKIDYQYWKYAHNAGKSYMAKDLSIGVKTEVLIYLKNRINGPIEISKNSKFKIGGIKKIANRELEKSYKITIKDNQYIDFIVVSASSNKPEYEYYKWRNGGVHDIQIKHLESAFDLVFTCKETITKF